MTAVDDFMRQLDAALRVRGRARRRLVSECGHHLAESSASVGPEEAVRRFGSATALADAFDLEIAVRRSVRATVASVVGVASIGLTTLAMLNAVDPHASAPAAWAVAFFGAAQAAAACAILALLRAAALRGRAGTPTDAALLCRRNGLALAFAFLTMFAVGAALPGRTSAWVVLGGPAIAMLAAVALTRAWSLSRRLGAPRDGVASPPQVPVALLVVLATTAAFTWARLDHGTLLASGVAAGIEAVLVIIGFVALGRTLGVRAS